MNITNDKCIDMRQVAADLAEFIHRASQETATTAEVEVLPAVASVLLRYLSSGVLDANGEVSECKTDNSPPRKKNFGGG